MYNEDGRSFTKSIAFLICVAKNVSNFETNKLKLLSPMIAKRPKAPSSLVQLIRVFLGFRNQTNPYSFATFVRPSVSGLAQILLVLVL